MRGRLWRGGRGRHWVLAIAWVLGLVSTVQAQPLKVGIVDLQAVLDASVHGKAAKERLKTFRAQLQQEIQARREEKDRQEAALQKLHTEIRSQGPVLSAPACNAKEEELLKRSRELRRFIEDTNRFLDDATQAVREKEASEMQRLLLAIRHSIKEFCEREGYQLVLEGNATSAVVLFGNQAIDLTPRIIQRFNHASVAAR